VAGPPYRNVAAEVGIDKRGCSGRKVNWVDFNRDGLLDLFVDCQIAGMSASREVPEAVIPAEPDKHFVDVAAEVGLDIPDHEVIDYVWFDVDNDGYIDLLTSEDTGFYLYRNHDGRSFSREFIGRGKFARADNPKLKGISRSTGSSMETSSSRTFEAMAASTCFGVEDRQRAAAERWPRDTFPH
jgi:hypothetical protein